MAEFALVLPVLMLLVLITIDFGRVFFSYVQMANAAREGANVAAGAPTDGAAIAARVNGERNVQRQAGEGAVTITTTCADSTGTAIACTGATGGAGPGNTVTVTLDRQFNFYTPFINGFFGNNLHVTSAASAAVLGYVPSSSATQPPSCSTSPTASFAAINMSGLDIFADPSASTPNSGVCNISGYNWDWGDTTSTVGTASGDAHTYTSPGTYSIKLEVTNQQGSDTLTQSITVPFVPPTPSPTPTPGPTPSPTPSPSPTSSPTPTPSPTPIVCAKPTADFTWTVDKKTYTYSDASRVADPAHCPITDWLWTFTDMGGLQSNVQNPAAVTYGNSNNSHSVTLRVTNAGGSTTITHSG